MVLRDYYEAKNSEELDELLARHQVRTETSVFSRRLCTQDSAFSLSRGVVRAGFTEWIACLMEMTNVLLPQGPSRDVIVINE